MIRPFGDKTTEDFFHGRRSSQGREIASTIRTPALRKLDLMNAAIFIENLRSPSGNRLEKLSGDLQGFHSIRVNQHRRLNFKWKDGGAECVEIVDYHE